MKSLRIVAVVAALIASTLVLSPAAAETLQAPTITQVKTERDHATLHWNEVSGAAGYNVYRNKEYITTVSRVSYRDYAPHGDYRYYVTAFDESKQVFSPRSNTVSADTRESVTTVPGEGGVTVQTPVILEAGLTSVSGYVSLKWKLDRSIDGVNVYRDGQYVATVTNDPSPQNVFNDYNGHTGNQYQLVAFADGVYSPKSRQVEASHALPTPRAQAYNSGVVGLNIRHWPGFKYRIYRVAPNGVKVRIATTGFGETQFYDTAPRANHNYLVVAITREGILVPGQRVIVDYSEASVIHMDLEVVTHMGTTTLAWEAPPFIRAVEYEAVKMTAGSGRLQQRWSTTEETLLVENRANRRDVYVVTAKDATGAVVVATSGPVDMSGECHSPCNQEQVAIVFVEGGQYYNTPASSSLPSIESQTVLPSLEFVPGPGPKKFRDAVEMFQDFVGSLLGDVASSETAPDPSSHPGSTIITNHNQVVEINDTTGVMTTTTFIDTPQGVMTVQTVSTPSATQSGPPPGGEGPSVQRPVPNSPMTNETTVTMPDGTVQTAPTTVTSPTGGTYSASPEPGGGDGGGDGPTTVTNIPGTNTPGACNSGGCTPA